MRAEGDYISGDRDSPDAPWNERRETCPLCGGRRFHYWAFSLRTREEREVTEAAYACLPEDEDTAEAVGQRWCRAEDGIRACPLCGGEGTVGAVEAREYRNVH